MSKTRTRNKRPSHSVAIPQTRDEANAAIRQIGIWQREVARIETEMNETLASIREEYESRAQPIAAQANASIDAVQVWAEANRAALTRNGKVKSATLPAGTVEWRTTPPSVQIRGLAAVLQKLRAAFKLDFIRTKEEVNKEAILATPTDHPVRQLEGITITQREEFAVTPHETELSEVA